MGESEFMQKLKTESIHLSHREFGHQPSEANLSTVANPSRMFRALGGMYGAAPHDTKLMEGLEDESDEDFDDYPTGWKRAILLASALVPYMIVS